MLKNLIVVAVMFPLLTSACTAPGSGHRSTFGASYQREQIVGAQYDDAFRAARQAMRERFNVTHIDRKNGVVRGVSRNSVPLTRPSLVTGESIGSPQRGRHLAEVKVRRREQGVEIYCRVVQQENATETVQMLSRDRGVLDVPRDTPVDRGAGTTRAQNTVWRDRERDRVQERQVLRSIREFAEKASHPNG